MSETSKAESPLDRWRVLFTAAGIGLVFFIYLVRLFFLQVVQWSTWTAQAEDNRTVTINTPATRGIIYDRRGTILARNVASYNVVITASNLPDDMGEKQEIYRQLSALIDMPVDLGEITLDTPYVPCYSEHGIMQIAEYGELSKPYEPVRVKCFIDKETAMKVQEKSMDLPGVSIETSSIRDYPTGELTAAFIGFLGPIPANQEQYYEDQGLVANRDKVGYAGLELQYQELLGGKNGIRKVEVDVAGKTMRDLETPIAAVPGKSLRLTIDTRLQEAATAILDREITFWNVYLNTIRSTSGVTIAMNPKTGEILAMVSYPTYQNNRMARLMPAYYYEQLIQDPAKPLLNHAVGDNLPAGSVFKLATAVGALNEGVVTPDQVLSTPPKLVVIEKYYANDPGKERTFPDWNPAGFGHLDFLGGIANSSNVYFYKLGGGYKDEVPEGLGICRLGTYAHALGYGEYPGIGLPDEEKGLIPDPKWKRITHGEGWSTGDTYISSVGQGYVLATPLQVLMSAATLANDGKLIQPTLVREILDAEGNVVQAFEPKMKWDITKDNVIQEFYDTTVRGCEPIEGQTKNVEPWVVKKVQEGMRQAVLQGTLKKEFSKISIAAAGKTGTAEYCDKYADAKNLCVPGNWPSHAWTVAYAPYDDPEIAVVAFVYNGGEGASVAAPIVRQVIQAYFELKGIDIALEE
ncbi:MAG: penicillin-binding protein 2 [Chloroflexi bacterium]|nr:penicillin-binding protein 2 [Chloroflexota bacterium]